MVSSVFDNVLEFKRSSASNQLSFSSCHRPTRRKSPSTSRSTSTWYQMRNTLCRIRRFWSEACTTCKGTKSTIQATSTRIWHEIKTWCFRTFQSWASRSRSEWTAMWTRWTFQSTAKTRQVPNCFHLSCRESTATCISWGTTASSSSRSLPRCSSSWLCLESTRI